MSEQFVLATDEVWRLQNGKDPECQVFQEMANQGHYQTQFSQTRQGFYVCTAEGRFLSSGNSNHPRRILDIMRSGLEKWEELQADHPQTPAEFKPRHRWEDSYPQSGLVLTMYARDLPLNCKPDQPCHPKWNQDPVWYSAAEARSWLPDDLFTDNKPHTVPSKLAKRLARFHLIDTVNGQTTSFNRREVNGTRIKTELVERDGNLIRISISGTTRSDSKRAGWRETAHGVTTDLLGKAVFDVDQAKFVEFEFVALGQRWGRTRFNDRGRQIEPSPIGFVVRLANPGAARVAPAMVGQYDATWVKRP